MFQRLWTECLWLMEKRWGRVQKREVMTMVGGGGEGDGVFGVPKGKIQPAGNLQWQPPLHHISACNGRQSLTGTARKGRTGCQCTCISNEQTVLSISQLPSTDRVGLSLLPCHLYRCTFIIIISKFSFKCFGSKCSFNFLNVMNTSSVHC